MHKNCMFFNNNNNNAYLPTATVSFGIRNTRTHMLSCAPNINTLNNYIQIYTVLINSNYL